MLAIENGAEEGIRELKRRPDLAETRLSQLDGRFEFVSGLLRDMQLYMHSRFEDIDQRFDAFDTRFDRVEGRLDRADGRLERVEEKIDARPRMLAEMIARKI